MSFYDLHPPAGTPGGPWPKPYSSLTRLVAHPLFPATRDAIYKALSAGDYPVTVKRWRIEQRLMNPTAILL